MIYPTKEFIEVFKKTPGALSVAESIAIMNVAALAPEGLFLEAGTYHGKSALSAIQSLKTGAFYLLDPIFEDAELREKIESRVALFNAGDGIIVIALPYYSTFFIRKYSEVHGYNDYSYVFIDSGSHQDGLPMEEAKLLEDRVVQGGIIAWHDFGNQFREPKEAAEYLVSTGKYEWIPIDWQEIFEYMKENNITEEDNDSWHTYPDLPHSPNFVGAIRRL